ncbi:MAG: hypothetical protein J5915_11890 [Acidaminococcaceae bacterium]|nr:hypothetical protein [Acidaminococcaceae bacterium]
MKKIFEPVRLNHLLLRNRLVRSATWKGIANQDGSVTEEAYAIYEELANFTDGDPSEFLRNLNSHMPTALQNDLIFIEKTGHTYQMKQQEVADKILNQLQKWRQ